MQIFRHIAQKSLAIRKVCLRNFYAICRPKNLTTHLTTSFARCFFYYRIFVRKMQVLSFSCKISSVSFAFSTNSHHFSPLFFQQH
ncbi:hypothetical protein RUMCAL_01058 [Ruminococcus callidus ATCC 27760]|uniref:Uncharacterized protein n=1 Tax=Ruminococcus callidus ATCC 27760 TaxID=411473 RepID=U2KDJ2_9FIRM|nr:hypothetical protein RUMCAL_01058 [Ruminococcus callidus ATCC 27760]